MDWLVFVLVVSLVVVLIAIGADVSLANRTGPHGNSINVANSVANGIANSIAPLTKPSVSTSAFSGVTTSVPVSSYPQVIISPITDTIDSGQGVNMTATVTNAGHGIDAYQWYSGSSAIPGANKLTFHAVGGNPGTFNYYVRVTDSNNDIAQSNIASIVVYDDPEVTVSPLSLSVGYNHTVRLTAHIINTGSIYDAYQWYNDTRNVSILIPNAVSLTYNERSGSANVLAKYFIIVTDSDGGRGKSNIVNVTVK